MTSPVSGGRLIAVPYQWDRGWSGKNTAILDYVAANPGVIAQPRAPEDLRVETAAWLVDPDNYFWELWDGGKFVGIFLVTRLSPECDALFHFVLLGGSVFAAKRLIWNFLGYLFERYQLQRISVEVPEFREKLIRFYRKTLRFRYEGEPSCEDAPAVQFLKTEQAGRYRDEHAGQHLALLGSRREKAHWDGQQYRDVVLLRLLKSGYDQRLTPGAEPEATAAQTIATDEPRIQASEIRSVHPPGR